MEAIDGDIEAQTKSEIPLELPPEVIIQIDAISSVLDASRTASAATHIKYNTSSYTT